MANTYLTRTLGTGATSSNKGTLIWWQKRSNLGSTNTFYY